MDAVKAFNNELSALYDVRPPISKGKITSITRSAIKAIKFYKHVVQSVEKFIQKCKPEYKVPGLYVIDSIVRQSRNQFGPDKDLFAPRFAKNMQNTFANLFSCPPEDKGKIIRVLNLWQRNSVFTADVIQPLFDQLADPNNPIHKEPLTGSNGLTSAVDRTPPSAVKSTGLPATNKTSTNISSGDSNTPHWLKVAQSQIEAANKAILELTGMTGMSASQPKPSTNTGLDILQQIQQLQQLILSQTTQKQERTPAEQVVFDKKLLDFDYDDDDEENTSPHPQTNNNDSFNNILQNPEILRQLTALQQQMSQHQLRSQMEMEEKLRKLKEMKQQEEEFDKHLAQTVPKLPFASECDLKQFQEPPSSSTLPDLTVPPPGYPRQGHRDDTHDSEVECIDDESNERDHNVEVINLLDRSPSTPPSQTSSRRRHSRSRSRDRRRNRRSRSRTTRSRTRSPKSKRRHRSRTRSRDRGERGFDIEKDRERRKKGLPPIKRNHLSVCSTTLWVGHLSKLVQQEELSDTFGEFGDIVSIDVIPPRGCAFICMHRRQDATRALTRLKDHKLHGKNIMLAWAPGKGVKGRDYKDYWEIDLGVSYIPWNRLSKKTDFVSLEEGGALDEDTMPEHLKETILEQLQRKKDERGEHKHDMPATPSYIPLPDGIPAPPVPPVLAAALPGVMTVPPPVMTMSGSPAAPAIDTSQPPPNMSPSSKASGASVLASLPQISSRIPVMAKPGLMMPFSFAPPPLGLGVPNMMGNLPIGVPPPTMQGLIMQQQMMAGISTSGASPFAPAGLLPPLNVPSGAPPNMRDKVSGMPLTSSASDVRPYDRHPLQGLPLGMSNHKEDDSMDLEDEAGDDEKSRAAKARSPTSGPDRMSNEDRSRDDGRNRENDERTRDDRGRDRDKSERDRDRDRRDRDRGRERDKDRDRDRDYRDRGRDRDRRRNRSRDRDDRNRSRDREYHNRSRDRDNRRDRSRTNDRDRNRDNKGRDKEPENEARDDGKREEAKKEPVNQWVEVPINSEEKPSLLQRLRNIAEGGANAPEHVPRPETGAPMFGGPPLRMNEPVANRHGPPIVINLNTPGMPRPGFGPRGGPPMDVFRPEFGPPDFGPRGFGPLGDRLSPGPMPYDDDDCRRPGFDSRGRNRLGPDQNDDRIRGRFDHPGPRPLMEAHFDGPPMPPLHPDDMRGPPMHPDDMRGPPLHPDDLRGPPLHPDDMRGPPLMHPDAMMGGPMHPDDMMCPDDMRGPGPGPMFMDDFSPMDDPRMRFGPRGMMGPMPRGPMGPHGPGPVPLFGPRGPGLRPLLGRPPNIWLDNQGPPPMGDNFVRPPFDDRPGPGPRRGPGSGTGPRFQRERGRDRQTRWSKEEPKESSSSISGGPALTSSRTEQEEKEAETEKPQGETQGESHEAPSQITEIPQDAPQETSVQEPTDYERDTQTPCHDEPELPNIVTEKDNVPVEAESATTEAAEAEA